MIRKAILADINNIIRLTQLCAKKMIAQGIYQWNDQYPTVAHFLEDIKNQQLYVLEDNYNLIGTIVLSSQMDDEYVPIDWLTATGNNLYVHRLAIHADYWCRGYGQYLMDWAEKFAKQQLLVSIRLDTFSQNKRNQRFYEKRGYQRLGNVYFPNQSEFPFYCYELVL